MKTLLALAACLLAAAAHAQPYDLVIRNARVVDGSGSPWFRADVAVRGDTIARIAPGIDAPAKRVIDAGGLVVAPGFIDLHTHARRAIFAVPTADNYIRQGVTTIMEGPDGDSPVPLGPFLARLEGLSKSINIGSFVGQGSVRAAVIGDFDRKPSAEELEKMRGLVDQAMKDGAFGMSTGLFYVPGIFTPLDEVIELAKVAARHGGMHMSHMRDEASKVVDSVNETLAIGERGGLPTQVSHHKVIGKPYWGRTGETLGLIDAARARGVDATIDQYPYTASSTSIHAALIPQWVQEGGRDAMLKRLRDPQLRPRILAEVTKILLTERGGGDPKNVAVALCEWDTSLSGKHLGEIAQLRGLPATVEGAAEATLWLVEQGPCGGVFHAIGEEDVVRVMRHPATMIASDGQIVPFGRGVPHPRSYGTFVRVLSEYVREKRVLGLEDAVRRMSAFPAQRLGLADRGLVRAGMKADLVVFDPARVRDTATFGQPHQYPEGVPVVIVNGEVVFENGAMTAARPGRVLYRNR